MTADDDPLVIAYVMNARQASRLAWLTWRMLWACLLGLAAAAAVGWWIAAAACFVALLINVRTTTQTAARAREWQAKELARRLELAGRS